ncbi:hypothetical protein ACIPUD_36135 [Bradyrhizobium sp. CAR08]
MRSHVFTLDDWGRTLEVQEIECVGPGDALQLGSAAAVKDRVEVWCGSRRLTSYEPDRSRVRPLLRLSELLTVAEGRVLKGEQHIAHQEKPIARLKREGRELTLALSILDTLIEVQKAYSQERADCPGAGKTVELEISTCCRQRRSPSDAPSTF